MFSESIIKLIIMAAPFITIAGFMLVGRFTCDYFIEKSVLLEHRCSSKEVSMDIDIWHQFLSSKKLKSIEIIEGEFAGFSPSLNIIQMPLNSMSRLNLFDLFVLIHEGMHYYCNQKYLLCHSDLVKAFRIIGFSMQIIFVPLVIINSSEVTTFHLIWLISGWFLFSCPKLTEELFGSYHAYKFLAKHIKMGREEKKYLLLYGLYAWLTHFYNSFTDVPDIIIALFKFLFFKDRNNNLPNKV